MKTLKQPLLWGLAVVTLMLGWGWRRFGGSSSESPGGGGPQVPGSQSPVNLHELLASSPAQIAQWDITLLNLLCAEGLPSAENLSPQDCMALLDRWCERVRSETERHLYRYKASPRDYELSEGYFRMLMMAVVLYEDFSVRYNPERMSTSSNLDPNDHFFADSRDIFLHGLLSPSLNAQSSTPNQSPPQSSTFNLRLGTCSSMPVLYIAVGRRLGYPLKLATTKSHVFLRWEGAGERFDMEATGKGMNRYDDQHFKQWPFPVTEQEIQADGYLKSLTPVEELALFLSLRGHCLKAAGRMSDAIASYTEAVRLAPDARPYRLLLADARQRASAPQGSVGVSPASVAGVPPALGLSPAHAQATSLLPPPPAAPSSLPGSPPPGATEVAPAGGPQPFSRSLNPQPSILNQPPDPNPLLKLRQQ
jgi:hypothetical protein